MKKRVAIIGSTGSIGRQTLDVIKRLPGLFEVVGLTTYGKIDLLEDQAKSFDAKFAGVCNPEFRAEVKRRFSSAGIVSVRDSCNAF